MTTCSVPPLSSVCSTTAAASHRVDHGAVPTGATHVVPAAAPERDRQEHGGGDMRLRQHSSTPPPYGLYRNALADTMKPHDSPGQLGWLVAQLLYVSAPTWLPSCQVNAVLEVPTA